MITALDDFIEVNELTQQVHVTDVNDTHRFAAMFLLSLDHERVRWTEAVARHDWDAAAASAAEQLVLVELAAACIDHLRATRYERAS